jgi:hypothetical protein
MAESALKKILVPRCRKVVPVDEEETRLFFVVVAKTVEIVSLRPQRQ